MSKSNICDHGRLKMKQKARTKLPARTVSIPTNVLIVVVVVRDVVGGTFVVAPATVPGFQSRNSHVYSSTRPVP